MPDFSDLTKGSRNRDPRRYAYGVKMPIPETGFGVMMDRMREFRAAHGMEERSQSARRKSAEYLRFITFLFPDEETARAWIEQFGGEMVTADAGGDKK